MFYIRFLFIRANSETKRVSMNDHKQMSANKREKAVNH